MCNAWAGGVTTEIVWVPEKLYEPGNKNNRRATWRFTALDIGIAPDFPGFRVREKPELYETLESREVKRN